MAGAGARRVQQTGSKWHIATNWNSPLTAGVRRATEPVAEISPKVTNVFWGMDTRDANACFWIEAVRVNSAPMPSDRSNRICIDADGQLLPQA